MSLLSQFRVRVRALLQRTAVEADMNEELQFHLEREQAKWAAQGVSATEARRRARASFGALDAAREGMRDERGVRWLEDSWRDLRFGLRGLVKRPLYWATASITLGVGIAAATAIYSVVSMLLLRPLDVPHPDRLVIFGQASRQLGSPTPAISFPTLQDIGKLSDVFEGAAAYANFTIGVRDSVNDATSVWYAHGVTGNYFTLLGLAPAIGRLFTQADEDRMDPVVVLAYAEWNTRYARSPAVIGASVRLNGVPFTVIGVAPEGWQGLENFVEAQAYYPLHLAGVFGGISSQALERRGADFLRGVAMLRQGKTVQDARTAMKVLAARIAPERGEKPGDYSFLVEYERRARPVIVIAGFIPAIAGTFLALAMLALLIACVNVGNLVLSRTVGRGGELAVRRALGASSGRVMRELLAESALLGVSAVAVAVPLAALVVSWLASLHLAADVPLKIDVRLDWRVLAFCAAIALAAGLLTGLMPALTACKRGPGTAMRDDGARSSGSRGKRRLGSVLLVGQLAFSLVLVIAGALFLRSLHSITRLDLGLDPDGVVMATIDLSLSRYTEPRAREFYRRAEEGLAGLPGLVAAGHVADAPMGFSQRYASVEHVDGSPIGEIKAISVQANNLTPGAFAALRMRLLDGRAFDQYDDSAAPRRALVTPVMAKQLWPELPNVVGQRFRTSSDSSPIEVVGVVHGLTSEFPTETPVPQYFRPYAQVGGVSRTLYARVTGDPAQSIAAMRAMLRQIDPEVAVTDLRPMRAFVHQGKAFFLYRLGSTLTTVIGLLGLLQTLVGLYGVIAYGVGQREREFGIRLALGAGRGQLIRQVMAPAMREVVIGGALGAAGAALLLPAVAAVLAVSPRDPWTYALCTAALVLLAMVALYLPARRAANAGPMHALRSD